MVENIYYHNEYAPLEEKPVRAITKIFGSYLGEDEEYPIEMISLGSLFLQICASITLLLGDLVATSLFIAFAFFLDKLDGDVAREKHKRGFEVDFGKGTFIDGFLDILGIVSISIAVVIVAGYDILISCFAIVGPMLYWYVNAGTAAYLPSPKERISGSGGWKQFISYSKSKEVIMQIVTIATGQFWLYLVLHALIIPYTIILFLKKIWRPRL